VTPRKQNTDAPKLAPTHKIVTRAIAAERKRGHAAITPAPRKQRR
jgi:hypothetical protein